MSLIWSRDMRKRLFYGKLVDKSRIDAAVCRGDFALFLGGAVYGLLVGRMRSVVYGFPKLNAEWRSHWSILPGMPSNGSSLPTAVDS